MEKEEPFSSVGFCCEFLLPSKIGSNYYWRAESARIMLLFYDFINQLVSLVFGYSQNVEFIISVL